MISDLPSGVNTIGMSVWLSCKRHNGFPATITDAAVTAQRSREAQPGVDDWRIAGISAGGVLSASSISMRIATAESSRRFGSFSRHRRSSLRMPGGTLDGSAFQSGSLRL